MYIFIYKYLCFLLYLKTLIRSGSSTDADTTTLASESGGDSDEEEVDPVGGEESTVLTGPAGHLDVLKGLKGFKDIAMEKGLPSEDRDPGVPHCQTTQTSTGEMRLIGGLRDNTSPPKQQASPVPFNYR